MFLKESNFSLFQKLFQNISKQCKNQMQEEIYLGGRWGGGG